MNHIDQSARIELELKMGDDNYIGENVVMYPFKGEQGVVVMGDGNVIHDNTRILVGAGGLAMGDNNTIHHHCTILGHGPLMIGDGCWVGQYTALDCTAPLTIGDLVTIGYNCHVWTHIGRGIVGWRDEVKPVVLEDEVWLVGDHVTVNPGVTMRVRSAALAHSVVTKDTEPGMVYAGVPAVARSDIRLYLGELGYD